MVNCARSALTWNASDPHWGMARASASVRAELTTSLE